MARQKKGDSSLQAFLNFDIGVTAEEIAIVESAVLDSSDTDFDDDDLPESEDSALGAL